MTLGTFVRLLAIALGILSATVMARDGFNISLNTYLNHIINIYNGGLEYVALLFLDPAIKELFSTLQEWFGWKLQLYPHWKHSFVLLWLLFGTIAKSDASFQSAGRTAFNFAFGALCALLGGVMSGTVQFTDKAVLWWSLVGLFLRLTGGKVWDATFGGEGGAIVGGGMMALLTASFAFMATGIIPPSNSIPTLTSASPGLATLAALTGVLAIVVLFGALIESLLNRTSDSRSWWRRWLSSSDTKGGLDMLAVLGGAAFIVWLGNALA